MAELERRRTPRFYLISRVDVLVAGRTDPLWGAIANISRTGTTLYIRQSLKLQSKATLRFRFRAEGGRELTEEVTATLVWQRGEAAGLEFEAPLLAGAPVAQKTPNLANHIAEKEAREGK
jgi:hypothetical protein